MGRFGSPIAAILFGVALAAAATLILYWCVVLLRSSRELRRAGASSRAELLQGIMRRTLVWVGGTVAFTAVFWFAICHDLYDRSAHRPSLPSVQLP